MEVRAETLLRFSPDHEGIIFRELTLKKERNLSAIDFSFSSTEEKEQKFNQSLLEIEEIIEIKID